jgi:hypothetical protein
MRYRKRESGEAIRVNLTKEDLKMACCDCGSVHVMQAHHIEGDVWDFAFFTDNRATGQLRRHCYGLLQQEGKLRVK